MPSVFKHGLEETREETWNGRLLKQGISVSK
jgi:hypothetical protein